jgi:uncharacterized protein YkwD
VPVLALFLALLSSPLSFADTPIVHQIALPSDASWCGDSDINTLLRQVNIYRASNGYNALSSDQLGMKDAELRVVQFSQYMQQVPLPSPLNPHQGWDTTAAGIGYQVLQENLAYMTSSPAYVVFAAWNDVLHIQAMLNNQANVAGVSCIVSQGVPYWSFEPGCANGFCGQTTPQGPGVTIASPADSAVVSGQVTLQGTTAGNGVIAVIAVAVQMDGGAFVAASGTAAWTYALNSTTLSNGIHTVGVRATDASGKTTTAYLPLTVSNTSSSSTPTLDTEEWAFLPLINNYRAQNGAGPLQVSISLTNAAKWMSQDMATKNYVNHTDSTGRSTGARLADFGYTFTPWGENLAAGYATALDAFTAWQTGCDPDSTGACTYAHRQMMLQPSLKVIGMSRAYSPSSTYGWYWTADFGGVVDAVITPPTGGAQPPTIAITQPANGATLSGTVSVQGTAADSVSLTSVTVSIDGATPVAATGLQNWSYALGTGTLANGAHTITAKATNSSGLSASASVNVTVNNTSTGGAQPPTIAITQPANGATLSGTVSVQGTAADSVNLSSVTVSLDGATPAAATGLPNWSFTLGTGTLANGAHTITAKATNSAGLSASASVNVTVNNTGTGGAPVISYFGASQYTINIGDATTLSWLVSGATSLSIDHGVGNVTGLSSRDVFPTDITPYVLTAANAAGTTTATLTISTARPCQMDLIQQNLALLAFPPDIVCRTINEYFVGSITYRALDGKCYKTTTTGTTAVTCASNTPSLPNGQIPNMFDANFDWTAASAECWYTIGDISPSDVPPYGASSQRFCGSTPSGYVPINVITIITPFNPPGNGQSAPVITQQPQSVTVTSPQSASFSISATSASTYQWQSQAAGVSGFSNISGATGATYTLSATSASDNGTQFRCIVANSVATVTSNPAVLTVNSSTSQPPSIAITQPAVGATLSGTVSIQGTASDSAGLTSVVLAVDGGTPVAASGLQSWTFVLDTTKLSNTSHLVTATATNKAGITATSSITVTVNNPVSSTPPTVTIAYPQDGATVYGVISFRGTAASGKGVTSIYVAVDNITYFPATGLDNWSYAVDTTKLTDGVHRLSVQMGDSAGGRAIASETVTVNNTAKPPAISILQPAAGAVISGLVSVSGTASDSVKLVSVDVAVDGGSPATPQGRDSWFYSLDTTRLTNGSHTITARATNTFGLVTVASITVTVTNGASSQPPTISIAQPANNATVSGTASIQGAAADAAALASVKISIDAGAPVAATGLQNWTYALDTTKLSNGAHAVTATATNQAGLTAAATITLNVSNTSSQPPTISIAQPANNATVSGTASIQGTAADAAALTSVKISVDSGTPVAATGLQNWTYALDTTKLSNGAHTVTATATNQAGLTAAASVILTVSNGAVSQPPTISIAQPASGATVSGTVSIQGTAADAGALATVSVSLDGGASGLATGLQNWSYTIDTTKLSNGPHTVAATATNQAGLTATASRSFTVDNSVTSTVPTLTIDKPAQGVTVFGTIDFQGKASSSQPIVSVYASVDFVSFDLATGLNAWTYRVDTTKLSDGMHTFNVQARDSSGGRTSATSQFVVNNTAKPPAVTITQPVNNAVLTGTVLLAGTASDAVGLADVELSIDQGPQVPVSGRQNWTYTLDTTRFSNGSHTMSVQAMNTSGLTVAATVTVTVSNGTTSQPPAASITSPAPGTTVSGIVSITGTAGDAVGLKTVVIAVDGGTPVAVTGMQSWTYALDTTNLSNGSHTVAVTAANQSGLSATASESIMVSNAGSAPPPTPTVSLISPFNNASFALGTPITISASASVGTGSIAKVDFFRDGVLVGTAVNSPYSVTWTSQTAGVFAFTARATTAAGVTATSLPVSVKVTAASNPLLTVQISRPTDNSGYRGVPTASVPIQAIAAEPGGQIVKVVFSANGTPIGESTTTPFEFVWSGVSPGTYTLTATAIDAAGATAVSAPVSVTVFN